MPETTTILIVDDDRGGREALEALLMTQGYNLILASSGLEALQKLSERPLDLILLDVMMPGIDGYETCRRIRSDPAAADLPILMLTALNDYRSRLSAFESGADDYITKPYDSMELFARVKTVTRLYRYRRIIAERTKFQQIFELSPNGQVLVDSQGVIQLVNGTLSHLLNDTSSAEMVGQLFQNWVAIERREAFQSMVEAFWKDPAQTQRFESRLAAKGEIILPVELVLGRIELGGQAMAHITVIDIREKLQITGALQKERNMLHAILQVSPDLLYCKDMASRYILANKAMATFIGVDSQEDMVGKTDFDFFPRDVAMRFFSDEQNLLQLGRPISNQEETTPDSTGKQHLLLTTKALLKNRSDQVIGLVGVGKDITQMKRMADELTTAQSSRTMLQKQIEALTGKLNSVRADSFKLLAALTRELEQPVSALVHSTNGGNGASAEKDDEIRRTVRSNSARVDALICTLVDYIGLESGGIKLDTREFSVLETLNQSLATAGYGQAAGERRAVVKIAEDVPEMVKGDLARFSRLISNLAVCAASLTADGEVILHTRLESQATNNGHSPALLHVIIACKGLALTDEELKNFFDVNPRDDDVEKIKNCGGVGLAVSKKLVESTGGAVWLEPKAEGLLLHATFPVMK